MSKHEENLPTALLCEFLRLDVATGKLFWLQRNERHFTDGRHTAKHRCANWNSANAFKEAFYTVNTHGYFQGFIGGKIFSAARVVFAMQSGNWPENHIDHINGIKTDNRPVNLRDVPPQENMRNRALSANSQTGIHGVSMHMGKYDAYITIEKKKKHIGRFESLADAITARKNAEINNGYHENHGRASSCAS